MSREQPRSSMRRAWWRKARVAVVTAGAALLLVGCAQAAEPSIPPPAAATLVPPAPTAVPQPPAPEQQLGREHAPTATPIPHGIALVSASPRPAGLPRLQIPRIEVASPMVTVGLAADGSMGAPTVGDAVGWYGLGPLPGSTGNAVLAGHVDWDKRPAVFWRLRELEPGDEIMLEFSDGSRLTYEVQWSEQYAVGSEPLGRVYEDLTVAALTLITCTGEFDQEDRGYRERLVVRAVRA